MSKLTDVNNPIIAEDVAENDIMHIVNVDDPTEDPAGTSFDISSKELKRLREVIDRPSSFSAKQDNLELGEKRQVFIGSSANVLISGLVAKGDGHNYIIRNVLNKNITFLNESTDSSISNRISLPFNYTVPPGGTLNLVYSTNSSRWELASALPMILTATLSITDTEYKSIGTTPLDIVAAPGSGLAVYVWNAMHELDWNSISYVGSVLIGLKTATAGEGQYIAATALTATSANLKLNMSRINPSSGLTQIVENEPLQVYSPANPTTGNSSGKVTAFYTILPVS